MGSQKITLNDIKLRKTEVLRQIRETHANIKEDFHDLSHPWGGSRRRGGLRIGLGGVLSTANKAFLAYKAVRSVVSFFKWRRRR